MSPTHKSHFRGKLRNIQVVLNKDNVSPQAGRPKMLNSPNNIVSGSGLEPVGSPQQESRASREFGVLFWKEKGGIGGGVE